jgi:hypothetical protein
MPKAYILFNCESGYESPVVKSIKSIDCVLTCSIVYGVYHILVEILFDTLKQLDYVIKKGLGENQQNKIYYDIDSF